MLLKDQFNSLLSYHFQTTHLMLDFASGLPAEILDEDPHYGRGSIFDILFHLLKTSHSWRSGLETRSRQPFPDPDSYQELDDLRKGLEVESEAWQVYLDNSSEGDLAGRIELTSSQGNLTVHRWRIIQHVVLHGMQHHAELARLLTENGRSPGDIDYIFFQGN